MITAEEPVDLDPLRDRLAALSRPPTPADVAAAMHAKGLMVSDATLIETVEALRRNSVGARPLDPLLHQPGVTDILVNGPDQVYVEQGAGLELTGLRFTDDGEVRRLAQRLAASVGRRLDDAVPFVDARLADGSRIHAVLAPTADPGTCISLRVLAPRSFSLDDCVRSGSLRAWVGPNCSAGLWRPDWRFWSAVEPGRARPLCSALCWHWCQRGSES